MTVELGLGIGNHQLTIAQCLLSLRGELLVSVVTVCDCVCVACAGLQAVFSSCHSLRCVHLRRCLCVDDDCVRSLAEQCPSLEVVNLHGCERVGDGGLDALSQHSAGLKSLDLSKTVVRGGQIGGKVCPMRSCKQCMRVSVCLVQVGEEAIVKFATGASRTQIKVEPM